jgi:hypothetical protein
VLLCATPAGASPTYDSVEETVRIARLLRVSEDRTWRKLLHYEKSLFGKSGLMSAVKSNRFFLSDKGRADPEHELEATLRAFAARTSGNGDSHPQCVFRARYIWLKSVLDFDKRFYPEIACDSYSKWTLENSVRSVSLVFATGYLGNPASYYGHILVKFNSDNAQTDSDLLDVSVNYGAIVPDNEDPVTYIVKGVLGGYSGGFSHIQYYFFNHNYGENESRDLWEYELALDQEQTDLMVAHLWELLGQEYAYFFFRKNCAYRMAEIVELAGVTEIVPDNYLYSIPQTVIQNLAKAEINGRPLIARKVYRPSRQSRLYHKYSLLNNREKSALARAVGNIDYLESDAFVSFDTSSKQRILETLLDYFQFVRDPESPAPDLLSRKYQKTLALRLSLPPLEEDVVAATANPPDGGRPPSSFRAGVLNNSLRGGGAYFLIRPAYYDPLDAGSMHVRNSTLKMFEIKAVSLDDEFFLRSLEIINIESVNPAVTGLPGDKGRAWRLKVGVEQLNLACGDCLTGRLQGDMGYAGRIGNRVLLGGYAGGVIQNDRDNSGNYYARASLFANIEMHERFGLRLYAERRNYIDGKLENDNLRTSQRKVRWDWAGIGRSAAYLFSKGSCRPRSNLQHSRFSHIGTVYLKIRNTSLNPDHDAISRAHRSRVLRGFRYGSKAALFIPYVLALHAPAVLCALRPVPAPAPPPTQWRPNRIRVQADRVDAVFHQEARVIRIIGMRLAADADLAGRDDARQRSPGGVASLRQALPHHLAQHPLRFVDGWQKGIISFTCGTHVLAHAPIRARSSAEAQHRVVFRRLEIAAAQQTRVLVGLEIGHAHDYRIRIEGRCDSAAPSESFSTKKSAPLA